MKALRTRPSRRFIWIYRIGHAIWPDDYDELVDQDLVVGTWLQGPRRRSVSTKRILLLSQIDVGPGRRLCPRAALDLSRPGAFRWRQRVGEGAKDKLSLSLLRGAPN